MPQVGSATADGIVRVGVPPPSSHARTQSSTGREPEMHGHVYDLCNDNNGDQYLQTTKELQMLIGRKAKKFTAELVQSITSLELEMPEEPDTPDEATAGVVTIALWKQALLDHKERIQVYDDFKAYVYNVVLGQSSDALHDRLKSHEQVPAAMQDGLALLRPHREDCDALQSCT